jgi:hypothetical protein
MSELPTRIKFMRGVTLGMVAGLVVPILIAVWFRSAGLLAVTAGGWSIISTFLVVIWMEIATQEATRSVGGGA